MYLQQKVAIKIYKKQRDQFHINGFLKEAAILEKLRHPNILLYMGFSIYQDNCLMVSEYLENGSLFDHLHEKKTKLNRKLILKIIIEILKGLTYMRNKKIVHRDIKSSNILIDQFWNIKLADFGLSKRIMGLQHVKKSRVGTPNWMAPEICRGEKYSYSADIYSFGVVVWEIVTMRVPFKQISAQNIIKLVSDCKEIPL